MTDIIALSNFGPAPRYDIADDDILVIDGEKYCLAVDIENDETRKVGHVLRSVYHPTIVNRVSHEDLSIRVATGAYGYIKHGLAPGIQKADMLAGLKDGANRSIAYLSEQKRHETWCKFAYVINFLGELRTGFYHLSDRHVFLSLESTYVKLKSANKDSKWPIAKPPSVRTFWRWLERVQSCTIEIGANEPWENAYLPTALISRAGGKEASRRHPGVRAIIDEITPTYLTRERPTFREVYKCILRAIKAAQDNGTIPPNVWIPSETTVFAEFRSRVSAYQISLARYGRAAASAKYQPFGELREPLRPLERVEIDDWEIHLATLVRPEVLNLLPPEERAKLLSERLNLCLAVDGATGVTLAIQISGGPQTARVIRVARLCFSDQTKWLAALGVKNRFPYYGQVAQFFSDNAKTLANLAVQHATSEVGSSWIPGPKSTPRLRPMVETTFAKISVQALNIPGRTFSNPVDRGDYESERCASLTAEGLLRVLAGYLMDVLVFVGVETRFQESPHDAWVRLTEAYSRRLPPDPEQLRVAFGVRCTRKLTAKGVRFLHNYYVGPDLHELHKKHGDQDVEICSDELDAGHISVRHPNGTWLTAKSRRRWLTGVPIFHWVSTLKYLEDKHANENKIHEQTVKAALDKIAETRAFAAAANLYLQDPLTEDQIDRHEARLRIGFNISDDPTSVEAREQSVETSDLFARAHRVADTKPRSSPTDAQNPPNPQKFKIKGPNND